ncbi:hypothetical protein UK23_39245 [Lentzea aerocolonigenes]|uniref:Peptidase S8/S53 domain-containing protein n=1 Tax=Lentzea aerocolonigenes TaxID=68170 RepID=A0A0F0GKR4_LENAE|nr:S8/S53 family peptidase [Lentzea aerocolonigenes]KJK42008.1 hypothetical protein UK23_39245 [Lentzea aerocolonigenes]
MTIYWPRPGAMSREPEVQGFAPQVPQEVLDRYGAKVLDPATAVRLPDQPAPRPTIYRSSVLLVPSGVRTDDLDAALAPVDMRIGDRDPDARGFATEAVTLQASGRAVSVDAWVALQSIRNVDEGLAEVVSLDHLLFASAPSTVLEGVPGAIQGFGPNDPAGLTWNGYSDSPVELTMPQANRALPAQPPSLLGRRPVVAVFDTGIRFNNWLGVPAGAPQANLGPFVESDQTIQSVALAGPQDVPVAANPLIGIQSWCFGHGTFLAGIVQQIVPCARLLSVRVMNSDGITEEAVLVKALERLVIRVEDALKTGNMAKMVDVLSLSMGYYHEGTQADEAKSALAVQLRALRSLGVVVVAAAGNLATSDRFCPAAFSTHQDPPPNVPVPGPPPYPLISVSALNPNGSKALFGNQGNWVSCWAPGTQVVSTFPQDVNASRSPIVQVASANGTGLPQTRESADSDDYRRSGFRLWRGGTSFSAPHVAAQVALELLKKAEAGQDFAARKADAVNRANAAVDTLKAQPTMPLPNPMPAVPEHVVVGDGQ